MSGTRPTNSLVNPLHNLTISVYDLARFLKFMDKTAFAKILENVKKTYETSTLVWPLSVIQSYWIKSNPDLDNAIVGGLDNRVVLAEFLKKGFLTKHEWDEYSVYANAIRDLLKCVPGYDPKVILKLDIVTEICGLLLLEINLQLEMDATENQDVKNIIADQQWMVNSALLMEQEASLNNRIGDLLLASGIHDLEMSQAQNDGDMEKIKIEEAKNQTELELVKLELEQIRKEKEQLEVLLEQAKRVEQKPLPLISGVLKIEEQAVASSRENKVDEKMQEMKKNLYLELQGTCKLRGESKQAAQEALIRLFNKSNESSDLMCNQVLKQAVKEKEEDIRVSCMKPTEEKQNVKNKLEAFFAQKPSGNIKPTVYKKPIKNIEPTASNKPIDNKKPLKLLTTFTTFKPPKKINPSLHSTIAELEIKLGGGKR